MSFPLVLACLVAALATPAAQATPPIPPVEDVLGLVYGGGATVQDYCVYEVDKYGNRRVIACVPSGRLPEVAWVLDNPRS